MVAPSIFKKQATIAFCFWLSVELRKVLGNEKKNKKHGSVFFFLPIILNRTFIPILNSD